MEPNTISPENLKTLITAMFNPANKGELGAEFQTCTQITDRIKKFFPDEQISNKEVGQALKKAAFKSASGKQPSESTSNYTIKGYYVVEKACDADSLIQLITESQLLPKRKILQDNSEGIFQSDNFTWLNVREVAAALIIKEKLMNPLATKEKIRN
jgi:hypothetical protein